MSERKPILEQEDGWGLGIPTREPGSKVSHREERPTVVFLFTKANKLVCCVLLPFAIA